MDGDIRSYGREQQRTVIDDRPAFVTTLMMRTLLLKTTIAAAKACKAERNDANFASAHGGQSFAQFYGHGKPNAFGKCVSAKAKAAEQNP